MENRLRLLWLIAVLLIAWLPFANATVVYQLIPSNTHLDAGQYVTFNLFGNGFSAPANALLYNDSGLSQQGVNKTLVSSPYSNTITIRTTTPNAFTTPSGQGVTNAFLLSITNWQGFNLTNQFQLPLTVNGLNYTTLCKGNWNNTIFFWGNGTIIHSWLFGNVLNPIQNTNLCSSSNTLFYLSINALIPGNNQTNWNSTLTGKIKSQPSANVPDGSVSFPSGYHGMTVSYEAGGSAMKANITKSYILNYLTNDSRITGAEILFPWNVIEPSNGIYNWQPITNACKPWITVGKFCNPAFALTSFGNNQTYVPQFVQNEVHMEPSCGGSGANGQGQELPDYWLPGFYVPANNFYTNITSHFETNNSIGYIVMGLMVGTASFPFQTGNSICAAIWNANGYTVGNITDYATNMINWRAPAARLKQIYVNLNDVSGSTTYPDLVAWAAVNASVGLGTNTWQASGYTADYNSGSRCLSDICNIVNTYAGRAPARFELEEPTMVVPGSNGNLSVCLPQALASMVYQNHAQIPELGAQEFLEADNTMFANALGTQCNSFDGSTDNQQAYNAVLTAVANIVGYTPIATTSTQKPYLPANTALQIYMGFAAGQNDFSINNGIGIAPWLTSTYGKYDTANLIFPYYCPFGGSLANLAALPSECGTWHSSTGATLTFGATNTQLTTGTSTFANSIWTPAPSTANSVNTILNFVEQTSLPTSGTTYNPGCLTNTLTASKVFTLGYACLSTSTSHEAFNSNGIQINLAGTIQVPALYSMDFLNTPQDVNALINGTYLGTNAALSSSNLPANIMIGTTNAVSPVSIWIIFTENSPWTGQLPVVRFSPYPINTSIGGGLLTGNPPFIHLSYSMTEKANGVGLTWNASTTAASITVANGLDNPSIVPTTAYYLDTGQSQQFSTVIYGGTPPYTYKWLVFNSFTGTLLNTTTYSNVYSTFNNFLFNFNSLMRGNTIVANVLVTDNASTPESENSVNSGVMTINGIVAPLLYFSNSIIDTGQWTSLKAKTGQFPNSGTSPYSYNYLNVSAGGTSMAYYPSNNYASNSMPAFQTGPTGTFNYNVIVKDSATTAETNSSPTNSITVNTDPKETLWANSLSTVPIGTTQTLTANVQGGSSPYTYNFLIYNSSGLVANYLIIGTSLTSISHSYSEQAAWGTGTLRANILINDSATTQEQVTNTMTYTVTNPNIPTLSASNITADSGMIEVLTATTPQTSPYTYTYYNITGASNLHVYSGVIQSTNTFTFTTGATGSFHYNVTVTDAVSLTLNSIPVAITVDPALIAGTPIATNTLLDVPQYSRLSSSASGGAGSYTYQWYQKQNIAPLCTPSTAISGATSSTYLAQPTSGNWFYAYSINDGIETVCSSAVGLIVGVQPFGSLTLSNTIVDSGQYITATIATTSTGQGISTQTAKLYNITGNSQIGSNVLLYTPTPESNTVTFQSGAIGSYPLNFTAYDKGTTTPYVYNSPTSTFTVNPTFILLSVTASNTIAPQTTWQVINAVITGGTSSYTYNFVIKNSANGNIIANALYTGVTLQSNTFTFQIPSTTNATGTPNVIVTVTDSATTHSSITQTSQPFTISSVYPILQLTNCGSQIVPYSCTTEATILAAASYDVTGYLYLNGNLVNTTQDAVVNTITWTISNQIGTFNYVFNTLPVNGYAANSISASWSASAPYYIQNVTTKYAEGAHNYPLTTHTYSSGCITTVNATWNVIITGAVSLCGQLVGHDIIINSGDSLTTNNFPIIAYNAIIYAGNILAGNAINYGAGSTGGAVSAVSIPNSCGGSGGAGGQTSGGMGGQGGNTLVPGGFNINGNGATPSSCSVTNQFIQLGFANYSVIGGGAGGTGGSAHGGGGTGQNGGSGSYPIYMQANNIYGTGYIFANGVNGNSCSGSGQVPGGGGGGGLIIPAYNTTYSPGTYNVVGGAVGSNSLCTGDFQGGTGGAGNVIPSKWIIQPEGILPNANIITNWNPPVKIIAPLVNSTSGVKWTLVQGTGNVIYSNVSNFTYQITAGNPTRDIAYQITQNIIGTSVTRFNQSFVPLNMIVMTVQASNTPYQLTQYYPAYVSNSLAFYYPPTNYLIDGYTNTILGTNVIKGTVTTNLPLNIQLNYPGFAPFNLTYSTGETENSLPATQFIFYAQNTVPSAPYTRAFFTVNNFDMQFQTPLIANDILSVSFTINNNIGTVNTIANLLANFTVYGPESNFINPNMTYNSGNLTVHATAPLHVPVTDTFLSGLINNTVPKYLGIYLPNNANSSQTSFNLLQCNGYSGVGYYMVFYTGSSRSQLTEVESLLIGAVPFGVYLQNGAQYQIEVFSSYRQLIYTAGLTNYGSSATITVPCEPQNISINTPLITVNCNETISTNTILCSGIDAHNVTRSWFTVVGYSPSALTTLNLTTNTLATPTSNRYNFTYKLPNRTTQYYIRVIATYDAPNGALTPFDAFSTYFYGSPAQTSPGLAYEAIFGIMLFLIFLGIAWINEMVAMIGYPFILILGQELGIFAFPAAYIWGASGTLIFIAILLMVFRD